ncbi:putative YigZ family protein [Breznakia sp. PF5-3]|uniref:YigZ family protein n=1 Tax=unclassified Breznakia TaxID=2623764 RepID=UPI002407758A|nr:MULTISPECIES: YigZ family protein [unclassified Breznakia]MDF9824730.1 putative YigZ family protein [Breznakia sp. PM6-1]MDF9835393.1 putative YigZ family protein [Breznakia sp. PF5-3]MDF9836992.1 putative YigZ family protein [Breznakia sp. PFB2-8]MDF9859628.1 putative YigZ family protein [Breznakia sp. PH5-24]
MFRVKNESNHEIIIDKSRFICYLNRVFSEAEAKEYLLQIKKLHPNATHHCYAFLIGEHNEIQRSNDNGEPSGTAGIPILECLRKNHMNDTIAIVVRYFGGIKLGAGGLIRAYSKSTSEALKHTTVTKKVNTFRFQLSFDYPFIGKLDYYIAQNDISVLDKIYEEKVIYTLRHETDFSKDIEELSNGKYPLERLKEEIVEIDVKPNDE